MSGDPLGPEHIYKNIYFCKGKDGSIHVCLEHAKKQAWAAFWKNVSTTDMKQFSLKWRLAKIKTIVEPVLVYRLTRYPFTKTAAKNLDNLQRRMISIALNLRKHEDEEPETFVRRRGRIAATHQRTMGCWSRKWAKLIVGWAAHVQRDTGGISWTKKILHIRSNDELAWRRAETGRPGTRSQPGFTCRRWWESIQIAQDFVT